MRVRPAYRSSSYPEHRQRVRREPSRTLVGRVGDDARRHYWKWRQEVCAFPRQFGAAVEGSSECGSGPCRSTLPGRTFGTGRMTPAPVTRTVSNSRPATAVEVMPVPAAVSGEGLGAQRIEGTSPALPGSHGAVVEPIASGDERTWQTRTLGWGHPRPISTPTQRTGVCQGSEPSDSKLRPDGIIGVSTYTMNFDKHVRRFAPLEPLADTAPRRDTSNSRQEHPPLLAWFFIRERTIAFIAGTNRRDFLVRSRNLNCCSAPRQRFATLGPMKPHTRSLAGLHYAPPHSPSPRTPSPSTEGGANSPQTFAGSSTSRGKSSPNCSASTSGRNNWLTSLFQTIVTLGQCSCKPEYTNNREIY